MYLDKSSKSLELVLSAAKTTVDCEWSTTVFDTRRDAQFLGKQIVGKSNGVAVVQAVPPPEDNTGRDIKEFFFYNADSAPVTVTLQYNDGIVVTRIKKTTLNAGQSLTYQDFFGWQVN